ncbi:MAG: flagellar motor protein MotB [Phycisphaerae bacterium]
MIPGRRKKNNDDDGPPAAGWMITFSDCMTLLLCFFVMLLTFSAFDENRLAQFLNAMKLMDYNSLFPPDDTLIRSLAPPPPQEVDRTPEGSETPTDEFLEVLEQPQKSLRLADKDAFQGCKTFYLPSSELFWARGSGLTPGGRKKLSLIAEMMKLVPSRVVVREIGSDGQVRADAAGLERCHAVIDFFAREKVGRDLLFVSAGRAAAKESGCIEVSLLPHGTD